jgi:hypothetical protein
MTSLTVLSTRLQADTGNCGEATPSSNLIHHTKLYILRFSPISNSNHKKRSEYATAFKAVASSYGLKARLSGA